MNELLKNKKFLAIYLAWLLIHTFLLFQSKHSNYSYEGNFWPFSSSQLGAYDISEWLVYVFAPPTILFLFSAFNDKTTKVILVILSFQFVANAQIDSVAAQANAFANQGPTDNARYAPTTFDWKKCNSDRFVHSPCYSVLGFQPFDPEKQPNEYRMQEKRYEECESQANMETVKHIAIIVVIIIGTISLIVFGAKQVNKKNN